MSPRRPRPSPHDSHTPDIAANLTPLTPGTSAQDTPQGTAAKKEKNPPVPVSEQKVTARGCHAARIVPPKHLGEPSERSPFSLLRQSVRLVSD